MVLTTFELYERDKDKENFYDILKRVLQSYLQKKLLQRMPVRHSSFFKQGFQEIRQQKKRHRSFVKTEQMPEIKIQFENYTTSQSPKRRSIKSRSWKPPSINLMSTDSFSESPTLQHSHTYYEQILKKLIKHGNNL